MLNGWQIMNWINTLCHGYLPSSWSPGYPFGFKMIICYSIAIALFSITYWFTKQKKNLAK